MSERQSHLFKSTALLLAALLLQACGSAPTSTESTATTPTETLPTEQMDNISLALPPFVFSQEFTAANNALAEQDWMSASTALLPLEEEVLPANDAAYLTYLMARIDHINGDSATAANRLKALDQPGLHPAIAYRVHNFQRHLLELQRNYLESARLGVRIMTIAPDTDHPALKRSIWRDLQRCSDSQIAAARSSSANADWLGWLELASHANDNSTLLSIELARWQTNHPGHAAADPLPGGLEQLLNPGPGPTNVALLLPLSSRLAPAGKAIRDGYLANYYSSRKAGGAPGQVTVIDSDLYTSATEAYNAAVQEGAQLVIGPLSKAAVAELATLAARPVPTIALNRIDQAATGGGAALVQLSLAPEDEARQLARLAFGNGARRVMILRPAGAWGDKMEQSLREQWRALGGTVGQGISYTGQDDYSAGVKNGLGIADSEARRRKVRDMLATNVEFTPRRREDLDAIFMLSRNPEEARAIKPLLAFHYAGGLPVYASSSVYGGRQDSRDKDLDSTVIVDLPWLMGSNPELRDSLSSSSSYHYTRLNALGADAYLLQSRLGQLRAGPDALIAGDTGLLSMNPQLQIERELPPAVFDGDRLKPL